MCRPFTFSVERTQRRDAATRAGVASAGGRVEPIDCGPALSLCGEFGFHRFAEQIRAAQTARPSSWDADYQVIDTAEAFAAWLPRLAAQSRVAIRVEPTGHVAVQADIAGLAFAWAPGEAFYLPLVAPQPAGLIAHDCPDLAVARHNNLVAGQSRQDRVAGDFLMYERDG